MVACISDRIAHIHDFTGIDLPLCRFEVCSAILVDVYIAACVTASQCQKNVSDISIRFKERQIYSNHKNQWKMLLFNPLKAEQCAHCVCQIGTISVVAVVWQTPSTFRVCTHLINRVKEFKFKAKKSNKCHS